MTAKSVLLRPQGRVPSLAPLPLATPLLQQVISETARSGANLATGGVTCHLNIIAVPRRLTSLMYL